MWLVWGEYLDISGLSWVGSGRKNKLVAIQVLTLLRWLLQRFCVFVFLLFFLNRSQSYCHIRSSHCSFVYWSMTRNLSHSNTWVLQLPLGHSSSRLHRVEKPASASDACTLGNSLTGGCGAGPAPKNGTPFVSWDVIQATEKNELPLLQIC